jgi:hypothetical protein
MINKLIKEFSGCCLRTQEPYKMLHDKKEPVKPETAFEVIKIKLGTNSDFYKKLPEVSHRGT